MSTGIVLALAMALDAVFGEPDALWRRFPHPAILMGRAVGWFDKTMNSGGMRRAKGVIAIAVLSGMALLLGWALSGLPLIVQAAIAAVLLAQKSLVQHVQAVADALRLSTQDGRTMVARIVSRDTSEMTPPDIARAAIESAAENLSDGVIAPAFWCLVAGLPGLILYKVVNTADSMIGYRTPRHEAFGWAAARLDDVMNVIPARLTAVMLALAGGGRVTVADVRGDARRHKSVNAGWPEAVMARVLGIALAGPRQYHGAMQDLPWVNSAGRRTSDPDDIDRSVAMLWRVWWLALTAALVIAIL